jgi:hypothetical protein
LAEVGVEQLSEQSSGPEQDVGELARLYLGNILYALELASLSLEEQGKEPDAGFYRGLARKLAEAHGASKKRSTNAQQALEKR